VEIEKIVLSEVVVKEPVNKIVQVQKKQTSRSSTLPRTTSNVGASTGGATYKVTAYCPCAKCCGKANGRTASGTKATAGRTVAASSKFAFGTKLNIGGNTYTVEDRGGAINGNRIDIFVNTHAEALQWGVRYLTVNVAN
jgi:3D (Asp-Asp-Asp) domain-containing protein